MKAGGQEIQGEEAGKKHRLGGGQRRVESGGVPVGKEDRRGTAV